MNILIRHFLLLLLSTLFSWNAKAQISVDSVYIRKLKSDYDSIVKLENDSLQNAAMQMFENELNSLLTNPIYYSYPFDSLKRIGKLTAPDNSFRIFTWNLVSGSGRSTNYCIIQFNPDKKIQCKTAILTDNSELEEVKDKILSEKEWYGAVYYKILLNKAGNTRYYTLLGYDAFTPYISRKVVDVLTLDDAGNIRLGAPIFNMNGKVQNRILFSFSARVTMLLNYDESTKMIVFDHLSPTEPRYEGKYEYYGPDFSFDGLLFKENRWNLISEIMSNRLPKK